jgi:hypothetical protein
LLCSAQRYQRLIHMCSCKLHQLLVLLLVLLLLLLACSPT